VSAADPRDVAEILRARAAALARRDESEVQGTSAPLACFSIGGHAIAVPVAQVTRASALHHLTEIPGGPTYLVGVTSVDGHLVSLLDLAAFLGLPRRGLGDVVAVLVVTAGAREIGLCAEQLHGIEDVPERTITFLPGQAGPLGRVVQGAARELLVLDVEQLFDDPRLSAG
jgi:purine-binding chemotaxis protein CheW